MRSGLTTLALALLSTAAYAQPSAPCTSDFPNPYRLETNWATMPRPLKAINAITIDANNNFWGVDRCEDAGCKAVFEIGPDGKTMKNGYYTIGRNTLLSFLRIGLESRILRFAAALKLRPELTAELTSLAVSPHRTAAHDDLAFAIALAIWAARTRNPSLLNVD